MINRSAGRTDVGTAASIAAIDVVFTAGIRRIYARRVAVVRRLLRWVLALNKTWQEYAAFSDTRGAAPSVLPKDGRTSAAAPLWLQISYRGRPRHVCLRTKREALQYPCMATISRRLDPRWSLIGLRLPSELIMNSRWGDA